jgi:hypothetical protein
MPFIIDPKPDKSVVIECLCKHCGVRFGFTPSEARSAYYKDYGGGGDSYWEINCPSCGDLKQIRK